MTRDGLKSQGMTAAEALDAANDAEPGERLRRFESRCGPRGTCRAESLELDPGRWTFCSDYLTVYDDYGKAVNELVEWRILH